MSIETVTPPNLHDPAQYRIWQDEHVRFGDLDIIGHVNNLAMGAYFENARVALHRQIFPDWPRVPHIFVLVHTSFDYYHELYYPAQLRIGTKLIKFGRTSMHLGAALFHGQILIAQSTTISVMLDAQSRQPVEIPESLRQLVRDLAG